MKRRTSAALALAAVAASIATVVLAASSSVLATPAISAAVRGATVAGWILCGLRTWERRPDSPLGPIMVSGGFAYAVGMLNALTAPALFTIGSLTWVFGAYMVVYVALVFPSGLLPDPLSRGVAIGVAGASTLLWGLLLFGAATMPTPAKPFHCASGCPPNPFNVVDLSGGTVTALEHGAFGLFGFASCMVIVILLAHIRATPPASRRILIGPTVCLCTVAGAFVLAFVLDRAIGDGGAVGVLGWVPGVAAVAFPPLLLLGQARGRLFAAGSLHDMVSRLPAVPVRGNLETVMADALGDPSLRLAFPVSRGEFVDGEGAPIAVPGDPPAAVTDVRDEHGLIAVILHDPVLDESPGVVEAAGGAILLALENARLEADVRASARALRASRARLLTAGVAERRRLERDLHDTAQQRLVALRIKFALAQEQVDGELGPLLEQLGADVEATIDSVRVVGRGLYPPLLADQGLGRALTSALARSPTHLELSVGSLGRSDRDVEAAVYLCCRTIVELLAEQDTPRARMELVATAGELRIGVDCAHSGERPDLPSWVLILMHDHIGTLGGRVGYADGADGWRIDAVVPWPESTLVSPG